MKNLERREEIKTQSRKHRDFILPEKHILIHPVTCHHVLGLPLLFCHSQSAQGTRLLRLRYMVKEATQRDLTTQPKLSFIKFKNSINRNPKKQNYE